VNRNSTGGRETGGRREPMNPRARPDVSLAVYSAKSSYTDARWKRFFRTKRDEFNKRTKKKMRKLED
jgi:hypothetical protein